jgi:predicted nucleic acid-binding protein
LADLFVDTAVIVDFLRNYPAALQWKHSQGQAIMGLSPFVWMEVIRGALNKQGQERAVKMLSQFELIEVTQSDIEWAMRHQLTYHLSHNVGMNDCLIAAPAFRLQLPLYTQNVKHFMPLLGALAQKPY